MSDQSNTGAPEAPPAPSPVDEVKNLKAEFQRKLDNQTAQIQQLVAALNKQSAPPVSNEPKKVSVFEDEDAYARRISEETERRIEAKLAAQSQAQAKHQQIVNSIVAEYPEANDPSSNLHSRANEIYASLSEDEKAHPLAMKTAVTSAAAELGLKPKSKRSATSSDDGFSMGSSGKPSSSKKSSGDLDPATLAWAEALGRPVDDPNYIKKLKDAAKRTNWKRYE